MNVDIGLFIYFAENTQNAGESEYLKKILDEHIDRIYIADVINQGGKMYDEIKKGVVNAKKGGGSSWKSQYKDDVQYYKTCKIPFMQLVVTAEGYLTACCTDFNKELIIADLNKVKLNDAWYCENMKKLRVALLRNEIPENCMCYNCLNDTNNTIVPFSECF
jgi:hypothetical protein